MSHSFLALKVADIPFATFDNVLRHYPTGMIYSNDKGSRLLLDGYNAQRQLVHLPEILLSWVQWEEDPEAALSLLIDGADEYTYDEYLKLKNNPNSIWYEDESNL